MSDFKNKRRNRKTTGKTVCRFPYKDFVRKKEKLQYLLAIIDYLKRGPH